MAKQIFSKEALMKLRSPERLDLLLPITTPVNWMALLAVAVLLFAVVLWSIFGAFTVRVDGMGMILDPGGVVNVTHTTGGKVKSIYVHEGDEVRRGDVIAEIEQVAQQVDSQLSQQSINLAQNDREVMSRVTERDAKSYQRTVSERVYASCDGVVGDVMVEPGMVLSAGSPLASVRRQGSGQALMGVLYIPVEKGKRVEPGMTLQLAPNGVDTSQSGSLLGVVRSVSQYPVTTESMRRELANDNLVQMIAQAERGAVMEVRFDLVADPGSESGYLWTSVVGTHRPITPGSFCTGSVIIDRTPPLQKVFYKLSQWIRSR